MVAIFKKRNESVECHTVRPSYVTLARPSLLEQRAATRTHRDVSARVRAGQSLGACLCSIRGRLLVTYVCSRGLAWNMGLCPGDQITALNGEKVKSPQALLDTIRKMEGDVTLTVVDAAVVRVKLTWDTDSPPTCSTPVSSVNTPPPQRRRSRSKSVSDAHIDEAVVPQMEHVNEEREAKEHENKGKSLLNPQKTMSGFIKRVKSYTDFHALATALTDAHSIQPRDDTHDQDTHTDSSHVHGLKIKDGKIESVLENSPAHVAGMDTMTTDYSIIAVGNKPVAGVMSDVAIEILIAKQLKHKREVVVVCASVHLAGEVANATAQMKMLYGDHGIA